MADWQQRAAEQKEIRSIILTSAAKAFMAGQLFVREVELQRDVKKLQADIDIPFIQLPYTEAVDIFQARQIVTPEVFYANQDDIQQRSFSATNLMSERVRTVAFDRLNAALEGGGDFDSFAAGILNEEVRLGISPSSMGYLRTVFETNIATNYGAGRFQQMTDPAVTKLRPFVEYRAVLDEHTRDSHAELNGTVYASDDPAWHDIAPPNGYRCRCAIVTRAAEEVDMSSVLRQPPVEPDIGFDGPPASLLEIQPR